MGDAFTQWREQQELQKKLARMTEEQRQAYWAEHDAMVREIEEMIRNYKEKPNVVQMEDSKRGSGTGNPVSIGERLRRIFGKVFRGKGFAV